jgi:hypothetical protein
MQGRSACRAATWVAAFVVQLGFAPAYAAEKTVALKEAAGSSAVTSVAAKLAVDGSLRPEAAAGKTAEAIPLKVRAEFKFRERRVGGTGRDARALRAVRYYEKARATINVGKRETTPRLDPDRRLIVAQGRREGVERYSPAGPMTRDALDLLETPADVLALMALLPRAPVAVGDTWTPDSWAAQMLADVEAATRLKLTCRLESLRKDVARVEFSGRVEGATLGALTEVDLKGHFLFDSKAGMLTHAEVAQSEKRESGPYNPRIDVTATLTLDRAATSETTPLSDVLVDQLPLAPEPHQIAILCELPWKARFLHGRGWHLFHQTDSATVLRLLDESGAFVAQCNVVSVASLEPGRHTSERQFQTDVRKALGAQLKEITGAAVVKGSSGNYVYRVAAVGAAGERPLKWVYYLCAAPSGRQMSFMFVCDPKYEKLLGNQDLEIVNSVEFARSKEPEKAARR